VSGGPRVLIFGGAGQLGLELQRSFAGKDPLVAVDRAVADLAVPDQIRAIVRRVQPTVIVNAAAYTAVDRAESEPELAMAINARAPGILAEEARALNALFVHYSTDYVFDGDKPDLWTESDVAHPLNAYGASKLAGEEAVQRSGCRHLIFRTSWVYGPHGKNFLLTMLRLGREWDRLTVVDDQVGAPTTSLELARATKTIVDAVLQGRSGEREECSGLYHMTCAGSVSWCGFARAIFERAGKLLDGRRPQVVPIPTSEYPTPAKRPRNSVLSNARLQERFGVVLAPWEQALDAVMARLIHRGSDSM
jgi:dTDP-4-dehydrorhamnose reductase